MSQVESNSDLESIVSDCIRLYQSGRTKSGLDLSAHGVSCARRLGNRSWLRKMLTVHGIFQSDLHNLPEAFEALSEAFDLCDSLDDPRQSFSVWQNLGAALFYAELPRLGISAAEAALAFARETEPSVERDAFEAGALANIAYGCLFTEEYGRGLRCAKESNKLYEAVVVSPDNAPIRFSGYALLLAVQARLFQRVNLLQEARDVLGRASELVSKFPVDYRATYVVQTACALHEVYSGHFDEGTSHLLEITSNSASPELVADALRDLIEAHILAGRHERASAYKQRLGVHMQRVRSDDVLFHHKRHVDRLKSGDAFRRAAVLEMQMQLPSHFLADKKVRINLSERTRVLEELCVAAELHDDPSGKHPYRVAELSGILASALGIESKETSRIAAAAILHDVGKVAVPASILRKPGPLLDDEARIMRSHATAGAELLASLELDNQETAVAIARHHHEWWSGGGYPDGLVGEAIPIAARAVSLAEAFDAMTHDRAYRPRLGVSRALELIEERAGHQFDPHLALVFCASIRDLHARHVDLDGYLERDLGEFGFLRTKRRLVDRFIRTAT